MSESQTEGLVARCAELLRAADGLLITAGAGIGVDSGLPDFRGTQGFWRAYPALGEARLRFEEIANPRAFRADPQLAWGFYGHRLRLYRETRPNPGFALLLGLAEGMEKGGFVFTSNVDGQFQRAGFPDDRVYECHGSIHHLQCLEGCNGEVWPAEGLEPEVDEPACRMTGPLPRCPACGAIARPNILMFGDWGWLDRRSAEQRRRLAAWRARVRRGVVIEVGAGTAIPTVRHFGESQGWPLIRINPTEPENPVQGGVALPLCGLEALQRIAAALGPPKRNCV